MDFGLRTAVTDGLGLAFSRNGAVFAGLNAAAQLVSLLLVAVAATQQLPVATGATLDPVAGVPIGESIPTALTALTVGLTTVFSAIVTTPITIITIRTFVDGATDSIPAVHLFGHLGRATVRGLGASLVIGVLVIGGFLLSFLVPVGIGIGVHLVAGQVGLLPEWLGIIAIVLLSITSFVGMLVGALLLYVHLMFVMHEISVRNRSIVDSLRGSWDIARGHRLKLGVLSVGLILVQSTVSSVGTPNQLSDPSFAQSFSSSVPQLLLLPIGVVITAFVTTLSAAIIARAYAEITAVDAVGGQRSDLNSGDGPSSSETGANTDESHDADVEPAA